MKVSAFTLLRSRLPFVVAALWLAAHLPSLAPSLEDIDSINFALGLREFDPAKHQPHPPGYPVYIALGRLSRAVVGDDALALSLWSAIGGAIALLAALVFFCTLGSDPGRSVSGVRPRTVGRMGSDPVWGATLLLGAAPLFWVSGLRPMSDMPGLAAALAAMALTSRGMDDRRWLPWGALVAGLAVGIRSQTVLLTMPLLLMAMLSQRSAGVAWLVSRPIAALAAGGLAWAVPLIVASGGLDAYLRALGTQAELDFAGVDMLWLNPTPRRLAFSLYETFVLPWESNQLADAVAIAAGIGVVVMLLRARRALLILLVAFAPYTIFHLLLQETFTVRYALPTLPLVAYLAAWGLTPFRRAASIVATALVAFSLYVSVPDGLAYGREAHPAFRAIADAQQRARTSAPAEIHGHFSMSRPLLVSSFGDLRVVSPQLRLEWMGLVDYWRRGGQEPVWFFADPRRADLALIDPVARTDVSRYFWPIGEEPLFSGTRPLGVDWYRIPPPGWFAGEGWSLTPETGGEARARAKGPDQQPVRAWVRRRSEPLHLMIGTRHLGEGADPAAEFELTIDGVVRDRWSATVEERNSLRFLDLPDGLAGRGDYAEVTVVARAAGGGAARVPAAVRQFDVQPQARMLYGFGEGWHELESDVTTGRMWRWSSDRAVLRVHGPPRALRLTLVGESPLRYFDVAPIITVSAGGEVIDRLSPGADFEWGIPIAADVVARSGGAITITQDRVYLPGRAEGTTDARRLGLRLFEIRVDTVLP